MFRATCSGQGEHGQYKLQNQGINSDCYNWIQHLMLFIASQTDILKINRNRLKNKEITAYAGRRWHSRAADGHLLSPRKTSLANILPHATGAFIADRTYQTCIEHAAVTQ